MTRVPATVTRTVLVLVLVLATACSVSVGSSDISTDDLETQAQEQFSQQFPVDSVDCPEALPAEVDATVECTLESEGSSFLVEATVTAVEDGTASISYVITEEL